MISGEVIDLTVSSEEEDDDEEEVNGDFERESIDGDSVIDLSFLSDDDDTIEPPIDSDESSSEMTLRFSPLNAARDSTFMNLNDLNIESNVKAKVFQKTFSNFVFMSNI